MREDWTTAPYKDFLDYIQPTNYLVDSTDYHDSYETPVLTAGKTFILGYTNEEYGIFEDTPAIIFDDFTTASKYVNFKFKAKSSAMKILKPTSTLVDLKFIYYTMQMNQINTDTHKRYWISIYAEHDLLVPPLLEQKAIVAKIEQLFSELDNGIENLKTAQAKLKVYRQAVLQKAFEGEFTREWREKQTHLPTAEELLEAIKQEREAYYLQQLEEWKQVVKEWEMNGGGDKKPSRTSKPKTLSDVTGEETEPYGNLPTCWKWERFNNVTHKIGDIDHKMPKEFEGGLPYLSTGNLKKDGTIDFQNAKTISRADFNRLALKIKPERNDIIFPRYGTIGRNILVNTDQEFLVSYACAIIKNINNLMDCKFVYYYSLSPVIKKEIKRYVVQTTQANIGIASIENFVFPLCSLQEQNQIVQEIESRLSVCDKIEETIRNSLTKAEALRQSILKKAFEGNLLNAQELEAIHAHPNYESAEKLLKRIKQERTK